MLPSKKRHAVAWFGSIKVIEVPFVNGELVGFARSCQQSFNWKAFGSIQSLRPFVWRLGTGRIVDVVSLKSGDF